MAYEMAYAYAFFTSKKHLKIWCIAYVHYNKKNVLFFFISIFVLLTRRKATEALIHKVGNYPDLVPEIPRYYFGGSTVEKPKIRITFTVRYNYYTINCITYKCKTRLKK